MTDDASARKATLPYAQSLCLVALAVSVFFTILIVVQLIFMDFIHGNPHRTQSSAISTTLLFPLLLSVISTVGIALVFGFSQILQILVVNATLKRFGGRGRFAALPLLPITAIVTWYCYDYLTPTDFNLGINTPADWTPYKHGISGIRYLVALAAQAAVTLFSVFFLEATRVKKFRGHLVTTLLIVAVVLGGVAGRATALQQYKFIDAP